MSFATSISEGQGSKLEALDSGRMRENRVGEIVDGEAKNGMTCSQLRRQLCVIAGYLWPRAVPLAGSISP